VCACTVGMYCVGRGENGMRGGGGDTVVVHFILHIPRGRNDIHRVLRVERGERWRHTERERDGEPAWGQG